MLGAAVDSDGCITRSHLHLEELTPLPAIHVAALSHPHPQLGAAILKLLKHSQDECCLKAHLIDKCLTCRAGKHTLCLGEGLEVEIECRLLRQKAACWTSTQPNTVTSSLKH